MTIRTQVPENFRSYVRQFVRTWFQNDGKVTDNFKVTFPNDLDLQEAEFRRWLDAYLARWTGVDDRSEKEMEGEEEEMEEEGEREMEVLPKLNGKWWFEKILADFNSLLVKKDINLQQIQR